MTTADTKNATIQTASPAEQPQPLQKPRSAAQKAHVALSKARSGN
jgi:hypothetical protein